MGARRAPAARPPARPPARRPASTSARTPARAAPATPAPMQKPAAGGGMLSGIGSTIMQGMAFGTGSAMAHQAVGAAVGAMSGGGGSSGEQQQQEYAPEYAQDQPVANAAAANNSAVCVNDKELFFDCIKVNNGDAQTCSFLYEQLQQCQNNATQFQSFQ